MGSCSPWIEVGVVVYVLWEAFGGFEGGQRYVKLDLEQALKYDQLVVLW